MTFFHDFEPAKLHRILCRISIGAHTIVCRRTISICGTEKTIKFAGRPRNYNLHARQTLQYLHITRAVMSHPFSTVVIRSSSANKVSTQALIAEIILNLLKGSLYQEWYN